MRSEYGNAKKTVHRNMILPINSVPVEKFRHEKSQKEKKDLAKEKKLLTREKTVQKELECRKENEPKLRVEERKEYDQSDSDSDDDIVHIISRDKRLNPLASEFYPGINFESSSKSDFHESSTPCRSTITSNGPDLSSESTNRLSISKRNGEGLSFDTSQLSEKNTESVDINRESISDRVRESGQEYRSVHESAHDHISEPVSESIGESVVEAPNIEFAENLDTACRPKRESRMPEKYKDYHMY